MNTAEYIPWDALVGGARESSDRKMLPMRPSRRFAARSWGARHPYQLMIPQSLDRPLATIRRSGPTSGLVEAAALGASHSVVLTSGGETSVTAQVAWSLPGNLPGAHLSEGAYARQQVARHAWLDADARAFVLPETAAADGASSRVEFLHPRHWGFTPSPHGMRWTAEMLFKTEYPTPTTTTTEPKPAKPFPLTRSRYHEPFEPVTPLPAADRSDPFRCLLQLRQLRAECHRGVACVNWPNGDYSATSAPAYRMEELTAALALALGRCRLFGVALDDGDDFTLTAEAVRLAAARLKRHLLSANRFATRIASGEVQLCAFSDQEAALQLLEIRTDAHATYLALDEAYAAALEDGHGINGDVAVVKAMGRQLHQVRRLIDLLDVNIRKQIPLLRLAAGTRLLENWRRLLAPGYRALPPWWLDGCLEMGVGE